MTVNELNKLTSLWLTAGHGNKRVYQYYDCNYAVTGIGGKVEIKDDGIYFVESNYIQ